MKHPSSHKLALILAVLPLLTVSLTFGGYTLILKTAPQVIARSTIDQTAGEKQLAATHGADAYFIGAGHYAGQTSSKSKIQKTETGKLFKLTKAGTSKSYMTAFDSTINVADMNLRPGWTATQVGQDAMWIPGACAQKPSWLIGDHQILIDDGQYDGTQSTHYYALYDTQSKNFSDFGGTLLDDTQAKEKIIGINVEDNKLVFYIDQQDATGPYTSSTSFKHSLTNHDSFLIRRVIETPSLAYTDYRVTFTKPPFDNYHLTAATTLWKATETLTVASEGGTQTISGEIIPSQTVDLKTTPAPVSPASLNPKLAPYSAQLVAYLRAAYPATTSSDALLLGGFNYAGNSGSTFYLSENGTPIIFDGASGQFSQAQSSTSNNPFSFILGVQ